MSKTTTQKLAITPEQYESMIWNLYSNWSESLCGNAKEYQQVVANSAINAWFRMELTKCEVEFKKLTDRYQNDNVSPQDFERCYRDCTVRLFNIRPMALLESIKRSPIMPPVQGIKVFTLN